MLKKWLVVCIMPVLIWAEPVSLTQVVGKESKAEARVVQDDETLYVRINPNALEAKRLKIDLPGGRSVVFRQTRLIKRTEDNFTWIGAALDSSYADRVLITTKGGASYGRISIDGKNYMMRKVAGELYIIEALDRTRIVPTVDYNIPMRPIHRKEVLKDGNSANQYKKRPMETQIHQAMARNVNNTVDVMVLYTQRYADYYGSGLSAKIQASIDYANDAFANDGLAIRFHLAHQELYETNETNENVDILTALNRISGRDANNYYNAAINEDIRRIRARYAVDEVTLFRLNTSGGEVGRGVMMYEKSRFNAKISSYNVSEFDDITFAHESGHNMGCAHSRDVDNCAYPLTNYACGYHDGTNGFGTIMSYDHVIAQFFSTPNQDKNYQGHPVGATDADCARNISEITYLYVQNDDISETNEAGDVMTGHYTIEGELSSATDRDMYEVTLDGNTTFSLQSQYTNAGFYLNLYDETGFLIDSFNSDTASIMLKSGKYFLIVSNRDDMTGAYYSSLKDYTINIETQNTYSILPSMIYLLN